MTQLSLVDDRLDLLVTQAAQRLAKAESAAAVLEAKALAGVAYDAAKAAMRLAKAQGAHDEVVGAVHRVEADALEIEAAAKRRLADEYDLAREAGAVARQGQRSDLMEGDHKVPTTAELGIEPHDIMDGRRLNRAEETEPGITRRILEEQLIKGHEPTRAQLRREVVAVVEQALNGGSSQRHRAGRTPIDPNVDAVAQTAGACRRLVELIDTHGVHAIRSGFLSEAMRREVVRTFRAAHEALGELIEVCDDDVA